MIGWAPRPAGPPPAEVLELRPDDPLELADGELGPELAELAADRRFMLPPA